MCGEVVANDDSDELQFWSENFLDIGFKGLTIHCVFDDPWHDQIVVHQACNERLRSPRTKLGIHFEALSAQAAPVLVGQIGFYGCLVNEDKPIRMRLHGRKMVPEPVSAAFLHIGAQPFGGKQPFLKVYPSLRRDRPMEAARAATPVAASIAPASSGKVIWLSCVTSSSRNA